MKELSPRLAADAAAMDDAFRCRPLQVVASRLNAPSGLRVQQSGPSDFIRNVINPLLPVVNTLTALDHALSACSNRRLISKSRKGALNEMLRVVHLAAHLRCWLDAHRRPARTKKQPGAVHGKVLRRRLRRIRRLDRRDQLLRSRPPSRDGLNGLLERNIDGMHA